MEAVLIRSRISQGCQHVPLTPHPYSCPSNTSPTWLTFVPLTHSHSRPSDTSPSSLSHPPTWLTLIPLTPPPRPSHTSPSSHPYLYLVPLTPHPHPRSSHTSASTPPPPRRPPSPSESSHTLTHPDSHSPLLRLPGHLHATLHALRM